MKIDDISIKPSKIIGLGGREWTLHVESGGYQFDGTFDNLMSFMHCVAGCIQYFGQAHGLIAKNSDGSFRTIAKKQ